MFTKKRKRGIKLKERLCMWNNMDFGIFILSLKENTRGKKWVQFTKEENSSSSPWNMGYPLPLGYEFS